MGRGQEGGLRPTTTKSTHPEPCAHDYRKTLAADPCQKNEILSTKMLSYCYKIANFECLSSIDIDRVVFAYQYYCGL
jgi:hypothetical protein